ncbi:MAG: hypothetical protein N4A57_13315 [Anaeromicrobium sp.]|jgi:DNA-directed RNA polymerase specialized sigma subunit|uniref:hypothetical protein n=1 Tax=Anaeromicrobium sp. TaxID=1929132 RepID=UPI0025D5CB9D|nr:hypothetical protein [Anaeromicrobium sp.]MCT4595224.1 hypothetical protein [Anaeromicrobium sp.]
MLNQNQDFQSFEQSLERYVIKTLSLGKKEFYRKYNKEKDREKTILDKPISAGDDTSRVNTIVDTVCIDITEEICSKSLDIEDYIGNENLLEAIKLLTNKERCLLSKLFVECKTGPEIAHEMKVSKQYISKVRGQALRKIKKHMEIEVR